MFSCSIERSTCWQGMSPKAEFLCTVRMRQNIDIAHFQHRNLIIYPLLTFPLRILLSMIRHSTTFHSRQEASLGRHCRQSLGSTCKTCAPHTYNWCQSSRQRDPYRPTYFAQPGDN